MFIGSISTLSNILEKVTSSVGKGLATLSMDQNYVRERERKRKEVPSAVSQSLMLGVSDLFFGIKEGITGIIVFLKKPLLKLLCINFFFKRNIQ